VHLLRREVEFPARLHQRVSFYLGLASFLLSLSIILDAAFWAHPTVAVERALTVRRLHLRPPCADRTPAPPPMPPSASPAGEYHAQLMKELEHPAAVADDLDPPGYDRAIGTAKRVGAPGGRHGTMNDIGTSPAAPRPILPSSPSRHAKHR
jgi:hypothetical protein